VSGTDSFYVALNILYFHSRLNILKAAALYLACLAAVIPLYHLLGKCCHKANVML